MTRQMTKEEIIRADERDKERKKWIEKFDSYACIKDDKWYLEWKQQIEDTSKSEGKSK